MILNLIMKGQRRQLGLVQTAKASMHHPEVAQMQAVVVLGDTWLNLRCFFTVGSLVHM